MDSLDKELNIQNYQVWLFKIYHFVVCVDDIMIIGNDQISVHNL